jgi:glycogen debranching enzyme
VTVERIRTAAGTERITLTNSGRAAVRLPVELVLATDLAPFAAVVAGRAGPEAPAAVSGPGLRWSRGALAVKAAARPAPDAIVAPRGLLRWEVVLPAGGSWTVELAVEAAAPTGTDRVSSRVSSQGARRRPELWQDAVADADDRRAGALFGACLDDLRALTARDPEHPADLRVVSGAPWRLGLVPADALWAARMLLPLGTRLATGTLRALARLQDPATGRIPGVVRDCGPHLPPLDSGAEATLLFVTVLAEARLWGLPERETRSLLPAAERCLGWLRSAASAGRGGKEPESGFVPEGSGAARVVRAETQAHAHRAALQGAELLDAYGRPGAQEWRAYAGRLRDRFAAAFWTDGPGGGRPALALTGSGEARHVLSSSLAHLLDTGSAAAGGRAAGLLDAARTGRLARLLTMPVVDSGWGLRTVAARTPGFNPFGHRGGAVRVHETAMAVSGLADAGFGEQASALVKGVVDAAEEFGFRLPEIYAGEQRTPGAAPCPHPMACRPSAVAAAAGVHLLATLAGVRPDAPGGTVALRPLGGAPLGALRLSGLRVAGRPFSVRVNRLGMAMVEEAAPELQLGG